MACHTTRFIWWFISFDEFVDIKLRKQMNRHLHTISSYRGKCAYKHDTDVCWYSHVCILEAGIGGRIITDPHTMIHFSVLLSDSVSEHNNKQSLESIQRCLLHTFNSIKQLCSIVALVSRWNYSKQSTRLIYADSKFLFCKHGSHSRFTLWIPPSRKWVVFFFKCYFHWCKCMW